MTFEEALQTQADLVLERHAPYNDSFDTEDNCLRNIEYDIYHLLDAEQLRSYRTWLGVADNALVVLEMRTLDDAAHIVREIVELVIRKQHDYGHGNILKFGVPGLQVRMSDKVERIKNLSWRAKLGARHEVVGEALEDSYKDLIGYSLIGLMLQADTFTLPLSKDES